MVRKAALIVLMAFPGIAFAAPAQPWKKYQSAVFQFGTMPDLLEFCDQSRGRDEADYCSGFILGVYDVAALNAQVCAPAGVKNVQIVAIARKYIDENPQRWNAAPAFVIREALGKTWPCARP